MKKFEKKQKRTKNFIKIMKNFEKKTKRTKKKHYKIQEKSKTLI